MAKQLSVHEELRAHLHAKGQHLPECAVWGGNLCDCGLLSSDATHEDIASLRLTSETSSDRFHRFCGAIEAAHRLGYDVTLRILNDPVRDRRGEVFPLDIYAEARKR